MKFRHELPDPEGGEGFSLVITQLQNTEDLPASARTFAGESTQAIQREEH